MTISTKAWERYISLLRKINDKAARSWLKTCEGIDLMTLTFAERQNLIDWAYSITQKYGEASAAVSCEMYDAIAELSGEILPPAEPAALASYGEVAKAVNGTIKTQNKDIVAQAVGRLVKMCGVDTTMQNAIRDGAEWAWIPRGDTCAFCLALASRGWQEASLKAVKNGHAEHIHANCDCTYAVRFNRRDNVAGYNPDKYLQMYMDADGRSSKDKINSMRRTFYAENKERITASRMNAIEKAKALELSEAEEINV